MLSPSGRIKEECISSAKIVIVGHRMGGLVGAGCFSRTRAVDRFHVGELHSPHGASAAQKYWLVVSILNGGRQILLVFTLRLCLFARLRAQSYHIESMKLITPDVGWAPTAKQVFLDDNRRRALEALNAKAIYRRRHRGGLFR